MKNQDDDKNKITSLPVDMIIKRQLNECSNGLICQWLESRIDSN